MRPKIHNTDLYSIWKPNRRSLYAISHYFTRSWNQTFRGHNLLSRMRLKSWVKFFLALQKNSVTTFSESRRHVVLKLEMVSYSSPKVCQVDRKDAQDPK